MKRLSVLIVLLAVGVATGTFAQQKALNVDECVAIALEQNPDIIMGEFTVKIAGKNVTLALTNFIPFVSTTAQYYTSKSSPTTEKQLQIQGEVITTAPNPFSSEFERYSASLSVNQTLLNGGSNIANIFQQSYLKKSAKHNFEDVKQTTILVVRERYYNLLKSEKLLNVAEETLRSSEESYKRSEVLYEVGKAPKSDVLLAKVQLERDRLGVIQAQNDFAIARASLNHILGLDVDLDIQVVDNLEINEVEFIYEDAMDNAMAYHPQLLKRDYDMKASKAGITVAAGDFLPEVYAFYQYSWSHNDINQIKQIFDFDNNQYWGFQVRVPIFNGYSRVVNTGIAQLNYRSSKEALAQGKRDIALEVKQSFFIAQQSKKSIAVSQNAIEAAEEGLRLNREKYTLGAGTMLDLITAQVSHAQSQSDYIQSLYDYKYAVARLQKAMGKLEH